MADRLSILMGRLNKIETYQVKNANLKNCQVFGGELPKYIQDQIRSPEGQAKMQARLDKAEKLKLKIALEICADLGL